MHPVEEVLRRILEEKIFSVPFKKSNTTMLFSATQMVPHTQKSLDWDALVSPESWSWWWDTGMQKSPRVAVAHYF